ncbi:MAG TPA: DUF302 domain-containing protein [Egicoccus sp.]|nr:DUF302 domain-containing protein [Egicoccus sp.]HSK24119.1 DUF302 domain-containing protein [Egicoccus sp.]
MDAYTIHTHVDAEPAEAEQQVRAALADEGFGILTEIDVQATMKTKLDVDMAPYKILGACNPGLAHQAIGVDPDIGAMLPCNVVVRANPGGGSEIVAVDPGAMLSVSPQADGLRTTAAEARERIERALSSLNKG